MVNYKNYVYVYLKTTKKFMKLRFFINYKL